MQNGNSDISITALSDHPVAQALARFMQRSCHDYGPLTAEYDAQWRSPCEVGEAFGTPPQIHWQPTARHFGHDFAGLANAFEAPIHPDIEAYYGAFWAGHLNAQAPSGELMLLQVWNEEDRARLIENMIGHHLVQRRAKAPVSLFFACTEPDSDLILTVENATGAVLLEQPGNRPLRKVSDSLTEFLQTLAPAPPTSV